MKSKTYLFKQLAAHFNREDVRIGRHGIHDETYGPKSMIYLFAIQRRWGVTRDDMARLLRLWGFKPNMRYGSPECDALEVQVSYFKGHHWDE